MKKIILLILIILPLSVFAQERIENDNYYKAEVVEILEQKINIMPDGSETEQQNLKLKIIDGERKGEGIVFNGIESFDVVKKNIYKKGDRVLVIASPDDAGNINYYITDYLRSNALLWLVIIFLLSIFLVGGIKGFRSILALVLTFFVITKFIIPEILSGANPLFITLIGSFLILFIIIYLTEGFSLRAHIAVVSIFLSLAITIFLSWFFVAFAKLSGFASEEIIYLLELNGRVLNFQGILLAGIVIGALGVLDDVVISQVATVEQLKKSNPTQSIKELFVSAYEVGVSHISSMTNTLFLAYAGVSMPLLVLFLSGHSAFSSWGQIISNEAIATEITRTLSGSIGLILSVPISTLLAAWWLGRQRNG